MKKFIFTFASAALVLAACSKEAQMPQDENNTLDGKNLIEMSFTASVSETKAYLNEDLSVSFRAGDEISVFANGVNYKFTTEEGGKNAVFTGTAETADTYYAVYPYSDAATIDGGTVKGLSIGTGSDGTGIGTFNSKKAFSVAATSGTSFHFKNVCALLKVTVPAGIDLSEVVVFERSNVSTAAISGTFDVAISEDSAPAVTVTSAKYQVGMTGPSGSSVAMEEGSYFIPILPCALTKGLDLKLTFKSNISGTSSNVGRAFNGSALTIQSGKVYDLGTVKKTDEFVYSSFENNSVGEYTGNTNALSVVANPVPSSSVNSSAYCLKDDVSTNSGSTSGYVQANINSVKFPSSPRDKFTRIRMKVYLGTNKYYPIFLFNKSGSGTKPAKVNGVAVADQDAFDAAIRTDDWNVLEWTASQFGKSNLKELSSFQVKPCVNYSGSNMVMGEGSDHIVYFDDIAFCL